MSLILGQHAYGYVQLCLGWIRSLDADDNGVGDDDGDDCDYAIRPMEVFSLPQSDISANK